MERKVILYLAMSLDGFIADKNGGVGWMDLANNGEAFEGDYGYAAFSAEVDTVLMGMTTYRQITQELSPGAWPYVGMECQVFTHGAPPPDANAVFTSEDPAEAVRRLKARSGRNIWVCGGAQLARRMMALDLIDVYQLTVMPVILGGDLNTNTFDGRDKDAIREIAGSPALQRRCLEDVAQYEAALTAAEAMGYRAVPETPILTRRKPLPGGGCLGLRLDWLLLRGMTPTKSRTLSTRTADCGFARPDSALARFAGEELSDHNAVWAACRMGVKDAK